MSDANKIVVRRLLDLYNAGDWDGIDGLVDPGYVHHNNDLALNLAQFKRGAAWIRGALPDFAIGIEDMVAEGDRVAIRFVGRGTHAGSMYGETPTSKAVALHGQVVYRLADGRVAEDWETMDEHDLMKQIGAIPD
jgi:predicted ester cyclase